MTAVKTLYFLFSVHDCTLVFMIVLKKCSVYDCTKKVRSETVDGLSDDNAEHLLCN